MPLSKVPSAEVLRTLETAPNIYLILSPDLYILTASDLYLQATETTREAIKGKHIFEAFPENPELPDADGVQNINASLQEVLRTKKPHYMRIQRYDVPDLNHPGKFIQRYWDPSHIPVLNEEGEIEYIIQLANNVTEKVLADRDSAQKSAQIHKLNDQLGDANRAVELTNQELIATLEELRQLNESLEEQVRQRTTELMSALDEQSAVNEELIAANEELIEVQQQLHSESADRQKAIEQLKASEQNLRNMVRQAPVGMCIVQGNPLYVIEVNDSFLELIGKERHAFYTTPYWEVNAEAKAYYEPITDRVLATGTTYHANEHEIMLIRKGRKEVVHVDFVYEPMKDADGRPYAIMIVAIDITEKVVARRKIEQAEEKLRIATESANIGSWHIDPETKELEYNAVVATIFGYEGTEPMTYEQAIGQVVEEYRSRIVEEIDKAIADGGDYNITYAQRRFNDDEIIWLRSMGKISLAHPGQRATFSGVVIDVTEQVNARRKVEEAEEIARLSIETANVGTYVLNTETLNFVTSARLKELFGYYPDEEMSFQAAIDQITEDYRDEVLKAFENTVTKYTRYNIEYTVSGYHDHQLRWVRAYGGIYPDSNGKLTQFYGVIMDITEQKVDEQRKNDFISMVSHELKTPLTSMSGYLQMLQVKAKKNEDGFTVNALDKANRQVTKMTVMINGFLNVSRLEAGKIYIDKQHFDMALLMKDIEEESKATVSSHRIIFEPVEQTFVNADREKIGQVVTNFISNAVKYAPAGSTIQVACIIAGDNTQVSVRDEGMGIKQEDIDHLFDRYYRVEGHHMRSIAGFGIGLYLCKEIIQRHDGNIWVESKLGMGSTFYFSLPLVK